MKKFKEGDKVFIEAEYIRLVDRGHTIRCTPSDYTWFKDNPHDSVIFSLEEIKEKFGEGGESFAMYMYPSSLTHMRNQDSYDNGSQITLVGGKNRGLKTANSLKVMVTIPKPKTKLEQVNEIMEMTQEQLDRVVGVIS